MSAVEEMLAEASRDIERLEAELELEVRHARHMAGIARWLFSQLEEDRRHVIVLVAGMISVDQIASGAFALDDVREKARSEADR